MKFCPACRNMLYPIDESVVDGTKTAVFSCNKCDFKQKIDDANPLVYEHILREDKASHLASNEYLEYDPALEHLTTILCPNAECTTNTHDTHREVIYIRYDNVNMKYIYLCSTCDIVWKSDEQK